MLFRRLLCAAGVLHNGQSSFDQARTFLAEGLAQAVAADDPTTRADALDGLGYSAFWQGEYRAAMEHWTEALALNRAQHDHYRTGWIASTLCYSYYIAGDLAQALALAEEGVATFRKLGIRRMLGNTLNDLGFFVGATGDLPCAIAFLTESSAIAREMEDRDTLAAALKNLGELALKNGNPAEAVSALQESLTIRRQIGDRRRSIGILVDLIDATWTLGDNQATRQLVRELFEVCKELNSYQGYVWGIQAVAHCLFDSNAGNQAASLFGAYEVLCARHAIEPWPEDHRKTEDLMAALRHKLGDAAYNVAFAAGRALSVEEAAAEALAWLEATLEAHGG